MSTVTHAVEISWGGGGHVYNLPTFLWLVSRVILTLLTHTRSSPPPLAVYHDENQGRGCSTFWERDSRLASSSSNSACNGSLRRHLEIERSNFFLFFFFFFFNNYNGFSPGISNRYLMIAMLIQLMFDWYRTIAWDVITSIAFDLYKRIVISNTIQSIRIKKLYEKYKY